MFSKEELKEHRHSFLNSEPKILTEIANGWLIPGSASAIRAIFWENVQYFVLVTWLLQIGYSQMK